MPSCDALVGLQLRSTFASLHLLDLGIGSSVFREPLSWLILDTCSLEAPSSLLYLSRVLPDYFGDLLVGCQYLDRAGYADMDFETPWR
jgi:hypothetical protein